MKGTGGRSLDMLKLTAVKATFASAGNADEGLTQNLSEEGPGRMPKSNTSPVSSHPQVSTLGLVATIAYAGSFLDFGLDGSVVLSDPKALEDFSDYNISAAINAEVERQQDGLLSALTQSHEYLTELQDAWMKSMPYADYLNTPHWHQIREYALQNAQRRCQLCNSPDRLQVHHRTYERRGCEEPGDLTVLCSSCHQTFHKNRNLHRETR